jgi:hypothetical protein
VGHSAGSIFLGHLLSYWKTLANGDDAIDFKNLILFAPACTHDFYAKTIREALRDRVVTRCHHFHLDDGREQDDNVGQVYRKSLLYLVSRSYQEKGKEVPIMGMKKFLRKLPAVPKEQMEHHSTDDATPLTRSNSHGGFDNDADTMNNMLRFILDRKRLKREFKKEDLAGY